VSGPAAEVLRATQPVEHVPVGFAELLEERFAKRNGERFVLMLSGGPTAAACYARATRARIDWPLVDIYIGDERMVPADDVDANQRLVREHLIEVVRHVGSFTPMLTDGDPERCAAEYDAVLRGVMESPGIDLIHLGLGPDGHTASLFSGSEALAVRDRLAVATCDPNDRNPHQRLSVTYPLIDSARIAVFTVVGPEKHDAVRRIVAGEDLPAARVAAQQIHWLVDVPAFSGSEAT
jgi:6-phosphogluconolactonase